MDLAQLQDQFQEEGVEIRLGAGDLPIVELHNEFGSVTVSLYGAHVLNYTTSAGEPVLWVSEEAVFETGKPIRGGIPVCWPWFGPHQDDPEKPAHGLARISEWELIGASPGGNGVAGWLEFRLVDSQQSRTLWPYSFELRYRVDLSRGGLKVLLTTRNTGDEPFSITSALHSYFGMASIDDVAVFGLDGVEYLDQLDGLSRKTQDGLIRFDREVDRIYVDAPSKTSIDGAISGRRIEIESQGSHSTVVWNPWIEKAKRMGDFGDAEYQEMVCVETANAGPDAVVVPAGQSHELGVILKLL